MSAVPSDLSVDLSAFPGGELVAEGLADVAAGRTTTTAALLVTMAATRAARVLEAFGRVADADVRLHLVGGATAVRGGSPRGRPSSRGDYTRSAGS